MNQENPWLASGPGERTPGARRGYRVEFVWSERRLVPTGAMVSSSAPTLALRPRFGRLFVRTAWSSRCRSAGLAGRARPWPIRSGPGTASALLARRNPVGTDPFLSAVLGAQFPFDPLPPSHSPAPLPPGSSAGAGGLFWGVQLPPRLLPFVTKLGLERPTELVGIVRELSGAALAEFADPALELGGEAYWALVEDRVREALEASRPRRVRTAVFMLNMGGPRTASMAPEFLRSLFGDPECVVLPRRLQTLQPYLARGLGALRGRTLTATYTQIGGGSPLLYWSLVQGRQLERALDRLSPSSAPHGVLPVFRYAAPRSRDAVAYLARHTGVRHAVAFSQYPQWSCTTAGSSLNDLWRACREAVQATPPTAEPGAPTPDGTTRAVPTWERVRFSVVDRWYDMAGYSESMARRIWEALTEAYGAHSLSAVQPGRRVQLVFSAHSLPLSIVSRGDPYVAEVYLSAQAITSRVNAALACCSDALTSHRGSSVRSDGLEALGPVPEAWTRNPGGGIGVAAGPTLATPFAFVPQVGFQSALSARWQGPTTEAVLERLARDGTQDVLVVPLVFTSDHIETLRELDMDFSGVARHAGLSRYLRVEAMNGSPDFVERCLGPLVADHLAQLGSADAFAPPLPYRHSAFPFRCAQCPQPRGHCRNIFRPVGLEREWLVPPPVAPALP